MQRQHWYQLLMTFVRARIGWWHYSPVALLFPQFQWSRQGKISHLVPQALTVDECRIQYQQYADDIQLYKPDLHKCIYRYIPSSQFLSYIGKAIEVLVDPMSGGYSVLDGWNRLQLNPNKTERL